MAQLRSMSGPAKTIPRPERVFILDGHPGASIYCLYFTGRRALDFLRECVRREGNMRLAVARSGHRFSTESGVLSRWSDFVPGDTHEALEQARETFVVMEAAAAAHVDRF